MGMGTTLNGILYDDKGKAVGLVNGDGSISRFDDGGGGGGGAVSSVAGRTGDVSLTKADVGLNNVDNTSDADKPVSTAQAAADSSSYNAACNRSNHTGTQTASTISDFATAADARVNSLVPASTESVAGKVQLASSAQAVTGTDSSKAVHPAGLKAAIDVRAIAAVSSVTYSSGKVASWVCAGITYTVTYNANGSINTISDGTTTRTAAYNGDGSLASFS